ncbi:hypothetical protein MAR_003061 [Mya arenaria]|uniref:DZIP3-like HEPN domain-containing protein n=1 Tax=Mya arenaria TaxID=6604 RepID=A0ABY7G4X7_MYAAR|nr:hypothetical protein MAR_003061 [Mya arenaria]
MAESIETRHENWLRVVWGLLYVREGLQGYVDTKGKQQYQTFMNTVNAKCNNQTCDQCQINIRCQNGTTKVTGKSKFRPAHFCDEMYKEIQNNHVRNNPFWMNTDSTKWLDPHVGYWELAKCYLSTAGYLDKTGSNQVDASGLLSICMNSSYMRQNITHIQHFEELRNIRNMTLHDPHYELDGQTADDCLDKMIAIKFKTEKPPDIIHNKSLEEIESLMYNTIHKKLEVFVVDEVERKVKVEVKQEMQNYSDDRGNDKREHQVEDLRHRLAKYYQKHLNRAPISPLLSDKDERLDMFYVPPKMVEKDHRKIGVTEREQGTSVTAYRQLFCKMRVFRKSVFMVGEAGMGKSSCAAIIVIKMAHLAFTTLFSIDQTSALVFKKVDILSHENLLFVLKSGILQETKARSLLRKSSNYSFIHKTVQEFLAAIYMSYHPEEFHRVFLPFYQKNGDVSDISQVFVFMCGLNIKLANEMSALISDIPHHLLFRSDGSHRVIVSGYKEAKASQVLDIQLLLYDFYFRLETIDTGVLNDLLAMNKSKVRSISTSSETNQATLQEVFSNSTDTLTEVFIYDVAGKYDLSACNFLTSLSISGSKLTDIVVNTKNLFELNLKNVSKRVEYSIWQSIESESENLIKLKINCIKIIRIFRQTLPRLKQLHNLTIQSTELGELALLLPASVTNVHTVVNGDGGEAGKEHSNCEVSIIGVYCGSHREA